MCQIQIPVLNNIYYGLKVPDDKKNMNKKQEININKNVRFDEVRYFLQYIFFSFFWRFAAIDREMIGLFYWKQ